MRQIHLNMSKDKDKDNVTLSQQMRKGFCDERVTLAEIWNKCVLEIYDLFLGKNPKTMEWLGKKAKYLKDVDLSYGDPCSVHQQGLSGFMRMTLDDYVRRIKFK